MALPEARLAAPLAVASDVAPVVPGAERLVSPATSDAGPSVVASATASVGPGVVAAETLSVTTAGSFLSQQQAPLS